MNNPVFNFIEEGMPAEWIFQNMGFEANFAFGAIWPGDGYEKYEENPESWIEDWEPGEADGFTLVAKYDTEDGPCAMYVKPLTYFAKVLLDFGFTEAAQKAYEMGDIPQSGDIVQ